VAQVTSPLIKTTSPSLTAICTSPGCKVNVWSCTAAPAVTDQVWPQPVPASPCTVTALVGISGFCSWERSQIPARMVSEVQVLFSISVSLSSMARTDVKGSPATLYLLPQHRPHCARGMV
jgi:hypothetical protein